mmetsp:Transcript_37445/g.118078  ORF Transcript_37445/g.118078 Transcript_37445/m.118078 type:complete len:135 (+) Transcript_37445:585-989(+)
MVQSPTSHSPCHNLLSCPRGRSHLQWALQSPKEACLPSLPPSPASLPPHALDSDLSASHPSSSHQPSPLLAGIRLQKLSPKPSLGKVQTRRLLQSSLEEEGGYTWVETEARRPEARSLYISYMIPKIYYNKNKT